jgi:hypothetical protein
MAHPLDPRLTSQSHHHAKHLPTHSPLFPLHLHMDSLPLPLPLHQDRLVPPSTMRPTNTFLCNEMMPEIPAFYLGPTTPVTPVEFVKVATLARVTLVATRTPHALLLPAPAVTRRSHAHAEKSRTTAHAVDRRTPAHAVSTMTRITAPPLSLAALHLQHAHAVTRMPRAATACPLHQHAANVDADAKSGRKMARVKIRGSASPLATTAMPMKPSEADSEFGFSLVHILATMFYYSYYHLPLLTRPWDYILK